jgi:hypothetical protein
MLRLPAALVLLLASSVSARAAEIGRVDDDKGRARAVNFAGPQCTIEEVAAPVRAGGKAFRHFVGPSTAAEANYRAEFAMDYTKIGETYWLGWSLRLPEDFNYTASWLIVSQWAHYPPHPNRKLPLPGGGAGHHLGLDRDHLRFTLQHADPHDPNGSIAQPAWTVVDRVSQARGKWMDFVMHAKWTGDTDGFCKLWVQVDGAGYDLKVNYTGRTWWDNEDRGPYFKMGLYRNRQKKDLPALELFTDEYRLGDAASRFDDVRPDRPPRSAAP